MNYERKTPHRVIVRAPGLLDMLYRPQELSDELQVSARSVREWIQKGMPFERDSRGHLWINGRNFARWVEEKRTRRPRFKLGEDEAFCLPCHRRVRLLDPRVLSNAGPLLLQGTCPNCGRNVNRGIGNGK